MVRMKTLRDIAQEIEQLRPDTACDIMKDLSTVNMSVLLELDSQKLLKLYDHLIWTSDHLKAECFVSPVKIRLIKAVLEVNDNLFETKYIIDKLLVCEDKLSSIVIEIINITYNISIYFVDKLFKLDKSIIDALSSAEILKICDIGLATHGTTLHQPISGVKIDALTQILNNLPQIETMLDKMSFTVGIAIFIAFQDKIIQHFGIEEMIEFIDNPFVYLDPSIDFAHKPNFEFKDYTCAIEPYVLQALGIDE